MFKKVLASLILTATLCYGVISVPEAHNKYLRYEVGESVVQVLAITHNGGGTGFAIKGDSGKDYIMTNRHVCEAQSNGVIRVKVGDKQPIYRKVIYSDTVHDLCLIEGVKGLAPISIGSVQERGDFHYVVGHPGLRQLTSSQGEYIGRSVVKLLFEVAKREQCPGEVIELPPLYQMIMGREFICVRSYDAMATTAVIYPGNSGSPVVNKYGNLIGVAFAGSTEQERDNYLVPLRYVKALLSKF